MTSSYRRTLILAAAASLLVACVNEGASYEIAGSEDSISLLREQRYVWNSAVEQHIVVARNQQCQRRYSITPGTTDSVKIEILESRPPLYVLRQGNDWYVTSTEDCRFQKFDTPPDASKLTRRGEFHYAADGKLAFSPQR